MWSDFLGQYRCNQNILLRVSIWCMARVAISEYAAKKLLLGDVYQGYSVDQSTAWSKFTVAPGQYVVKVDDGTKKRNTLGLVVLNLDEKAAVTKAKEFIAAGCRRVLIEPQHDYSGAKEEYISCTLERGGVSVLYSAAGGVAVEVSDVAVIKYQVSRADFLAGTKVESQDIPVQVVNTLLAAMKKFHFSFIEINPFVRTVAGEFIALDAAVEIDDSKVHELPPWVVGHIQRSVDLLPAEAIVAALNAESTAAFSLTVFDTNAPIFTLLSGGGASLVTLDAFVDAGMQAQVGNYGEYSGAPSQLETKRYTDAVLSLLFASSAPRKVLVIAGGVANFTDITTTFAGVVDSCAGFLEEFAAQNIMVRVRRGGPRQAQGLAMLQDFFAQNNIQAVVSGPEDSLTQIALDTKTFLTSSS